MPLKAFLLAHAQPNYVAQVAEIADRLAETLGEATFAGVGRDSFAPTVAMRLRTAEIAGGVKLQALADLFALTWWCGLPAEDAVYRTAGEEARAALLEVARQVRRPPPPRTPPTAHALYTEALQSPLHSPSRGAVDYAAVLAADPDVARIDLYHQGEVPPAMLDHMRARLGPLASKVTLIANTGSQALDQIVGRGPYVHHVWCEQPLAPHISLAGLFGPVVMFTCGDEPPYQHADVYWYFHEADHMRAAWAAKGVPACFAANYRALDCGPNAQSRRASAPRRKPDLGLGEDRVLLVTVGNRLSVDMDEAFVTGMEATLRAHPHAVWLVVGPLPDWLSSACRQVLGTRFLHLGFEPRLPDLLAACDIFVNPFRRGGGDSATMAMANGAVVLARGDRGDVAAFVPPGHAARDAEDFFARLSTLTADPNLRADWRAAQSVRNERLADQARFGRALKAMTALAWRRYLARADGPVERLFGQAEAAAAA